MRKKWLQERLAKGNLNKDFRRNCDVGLQNNYKLHATVRKLEIEHQYGRAISLTFVLFFIHREMKQLSFRSMSGYLEMKNDLVSQSWEESMKDFPHELMKFLKVNFSSISILFICAT